MTQTFGSLRNVLQDLLLERKAGHQLLEPTILKFELLELASLLDIQATAFLPIPVVARRHGLLTAVGIIVGVLGLIYMKFGPRP